jgi:hypothetical protein
MKYEASELIASGLTRSRSILLKKKQGHCKSTMSHIMKPYKCHIVNSFFYINHTTFVTACDISQNTLKTILLHTFLPHHTSIQQYSILISEDFDTKPHAFQLEFWHWFSLFSCYKVLQILKHIPELINFTPFSPRNSRQWCCCLCIWNKWVPREPREGVKRLLIHVLLWNLMLHMIKLWINCICFYIFHWYKGCNWTKT